MAALLQLPPREPIKPPIWPNTASPHPTTRPCDPVARAVALGDYQTARNLLEDLKSARIRIIDRAEYVAPALDALRIGDVDAFLDWMEYYPYNLGVLKDPTSIPVKDPEIFNALRPFIRELRVKHSTNTLVITRFLQLCARKGMLAPAIEHFITDFATLLRPAVSLPMLVDVLNTFGDSIPETVEQDDKEAFTREIIVPRMNKWLNTYLRRIAMAGWAPQAQTLYQELPRKLAYVEWVEATADIARWKEVPAVSPDETEGLVLREKIRAALQRAPTPTALAALLDELDTRAPSHPTLAARFRRHLIRRPGSTFNPLSQSRGERRLDQAEIYRLCKVRRYKEAIIYFLQRYKYSGLPPHPLVDSLKVEPILKMLEPPLPKIHMITTLLPALMETLPDIESGLLPFHQAYIHMAKDLPPIQQPTQATHSVFVKKVVKVCGGARGRFVLRSIAERGFDPGDMAPTWLLLHYARRGEFQQLEALLNRMQEGKRIHPKRKIIYSPPPPETIDKMTEIVRTRAAMDRAYLDAFEATMEQREQG